MPPFEEMDRVDTALLWERIGTGGRGQAIVASIPIELQVQWDGSQSVVLDAVGNKIAVDSSVIADRVILVGSIMWQGSLDDLEGTGTSPPTADLMEVKYYNGTSDIKGRNMVHEVKLLRYNSELPLG